MILDKKKFELALARACMNTMDIHKKGIPKGTIGNAISGKPIMPKTAGKIAKALGCNIEDIIVVD